jgi:hypothetical protein
MARDPAKGDARQALRRLRAARRRRYLDPGAWADTLYRVYVTAILGGLAIALVSGALGDARASEDAVEEIARRGPALLGLLVALAVAGGLRSGGRGGPLAIEAPDLQHVLLSPIERGWLLRRLALRRLRTAAFAGAVVGAVIGNLAFRRLPGTPIEWLGSAAAFGALVPLAAYGAAMIASGLRLRWSALNLVGLGVAGWSLVDLYLETTTSPASALGQLALLPLEPGGGSLAAPIAGAVVALAVAYLGVRWIDGTSLEAARRRAGLAAELRFALTFQDLRAVILLRRELASELPRRRPWVRLDSSSQSRHPVWRRGWRSFLRWPAVRGGRVCLLGAVAGLALCGAWQGTTPLVLVAAFALLVAGLDAVEPLAQEVDHPTRRDLLPVDPRRLIGRALAAPTVLMLGVSLVALATALAVTQARLVLEVGVVMVLPAALLILCSAALSATNDPSKYLLTPVLGYIQTAIPFALAVSAVAPVLVAREAALQGHPPAAAAALAAAVVVLVSLAAFWALGKRVAGGESDLVSAIVGRDTDLAASVGIEVGR